MQSDKKTHNNQIHLVLQKGIGKAILTQDYSQKDFLHTLQQKTFS
jgi:3-dehydroquinate synthetase